ncbi:unnamed protein product [Protopolystoma xenopodis]|uniref:Uncharacterized protein n=1 Tax=Protopolystoma xenopodis TaxID=117903 RepID=A0A448XK69_9PLAT|nr:unnamed protein product [Protopolystoma xenopodis]
MRTLHTPRWLSHHPHPPSPICWEYGSEPAILLRSPPSLGLITVSLLPRKIRLPSPWFNISLDSCHPIPRLSPASLWFAYFTRPLPPHLGQSYWPYPASG